MFWHGQFVICLLNVILQLKIMLWCSSFIGTVFMPIWLHLWSTNKLEDRGTCLESPWICIHFWPARIWSWSYFPETTIQLGNGAEKYGNNIRRPHHWKQGQRVLPGISGLLKARNICEILFISGQEVSVLAFTRRPRNWFVTLVCWLLSLLYAVLVCFALMLKCQEWMVSLEPEIC